MENLILTRPNGASSMARRSSSISLCRPLWQSGWIRTFIRPLPPKSYLEDAWNSWRVLVPNTPSLSDGSPLRGARLLIIDPIKGFHHNSRAAAVRSVLQRELGLALKYLQSLLGAQVGAILWVRDHPDAITVARNREFAFHCSRRQYASVFCTHGFTQ